MRDYQLIIRIPFEALDDADARGKARKLIATHSPDNAVNKLQRLREKQEPEGIRV